jgi:hypothetical protein
MRCPHCGYCSECGRTDPPHNHTQPWKPQPPPPPIPRFGAEGWRCDCGAWVYSHQIHTCPYRGITCIASTTTGTGGPNA